MLVCAECRELVYKRRYRAHWKGKLCDAGDKHEVRRLQHDSSVVERIEVT